jgi:hypothetical protein
MERIGVRRRAPGWWIIGAVASLLAAKAPASPALADPNDEFFRAGNFEASVAGGVLFSPSPSGEKRTFDFAMFTGRLGVMLTSPHGEHWWRGNWELAGETFGSAIITGEGDYLFGADAWLGYNFVPAHSRCTPFVQVGFGAALTDADHRIVGQDFNFISGAGLGLRYRLGENWSLTAEYRLHHISNAGMSDQNRGITVHGPMLGVSWYF